jgi:uncharacterized membrane protein
MKNIFSKSRVETFSDGIFAIIITLLVLEINVPHINEVHSSAELKEALLGLLPKIISWIISFFTIAVIWVNHHKIFKQIKLLDSRIFWWNAVLLLWCTLIPFPTAVLGDYPNNKVSIILYGAVMALMAASFSFMRFYTIRKPGLLEESVDLILFRKGTYSSVLFGPLMYLAGVTLGFLHPYLAFVIFLGIPVYFIFSETRN